MNGTRTTAREEDGALVIRIECGPGVTMTPGRSAEAAGAAVALLNQIAAERGGKVAYRVTDLRWRDDGEEYLEIRLPLGGGG